MRDRKQCFMSLLFICYLVVILRITVFRSGFGTHPFFSGTINDLLFTGYITILADHKWGSFLYLFFGNIVWFVPFGFFLCRRFRRSLPQTLLFGFLLSLCIEALQFVFATGISELDDLLLNTTGALDGWLFGRRTRREKKNPIFSCFRHG